MEASVKIGIGLPNQVRNVRGAVIPQWASLAETAGFSTLGTVGRVAYPGVADTVTLAAAAGATSTIGLFSNVLIAPAWPATLLAKELGGIDAVSGGRLTLGLGIGPRPDDFTIEEAPFANRGKRFDNDLKIYRDVWDGKPVGGGENAAVSEGSRQIPILFGGMAPLALKRMATWGEGYVGASIPPEMAAGTFEAAKSAWTEAGREGTPRIVAISYFVFADEERGRENVRDYYSSAPEFAPLAAGTFPAGAEAIKERIAAFADLGVEELILNPTLDDIDEVQRLAEVVF
jgi:alkanesulfonate monooxygenase SsuD/methylene tetrahydromethanopterin reductase-like flavin-dependent oxidoreductase (luciferase family)